MRINRKVIIAIVSLSLLAAFGYFFGESIFDYTYIRYVELEDARLGPFLPQIDEVEIIRLNGLTKSALSSGFLESRVSDYVIVGSVTLHEKDAEKVAQLWRYLPRNPRYSAMCHEPLFALRFRKNGKLLLQTTICWHCSNYSLSTSESPWWDTELGFDSLAPASQKLLSTLEAYVPARAGK